MNWSNWESKVFPQYGPVSNHVLGSKVAYLLYQNIPIPKYGEEKGPWPWIGKHRGVSGGDWPVALSSPDDTVARSSFSIPSPSMPQGWLPSIPWSFSGARNANGGIERCQPRTGLRASSLSITNAENAPGLSLNHSYNSPTNELLKTRRREGNFFLPRWSNPGLRKSDSSIGGLPASLLQEGLSPGTDDT